MTYDKDSQSNYNKKRKQYKAQYSLCDRDEVARIDKYLNDNGLTAGTYIKSLIKADLDAKGIPYPVDNTTSDNMSD